MRSWVRVAMAGCGLLLMGGCGHDFEPPDQHVRIDSATVHYVAARFDTISWTSGPEREMAGNAVYAERCGRCHGPLGRGQTAYATERGILVPSLVEPGWRLAEVDSVRKAVFVGHEDGMPIFGDRGLSPRDIDAVAGYLLDVLRPEVLGGR